MIPGATTDPHVGVGDAISKQYSSTRALKGDYTRTRKRDYRGAINDLGLTLSR